VTDTQKIFRNPPRVDADTITWQLKDQKLDGKTLANTKEIIMKRVN